MDQSKTKELLDLSPMLKCGVYMLKHRGLVVYVGQSTQPLTRLYSHATATQRAKQGKPRFKNGALEQAMLFNEIWFVPCMLGELDDVERELIKRHQPKYNTLCRPKMKEEIKLTIGGVALVLNAGGPPLQQAMRR